jgi:4'-phosphopantetheinyl transferase EntD
VNVLARAVLPDLLPAGVESAEGHPQSLSAQAVLYAEEQAAIARAVPTRREQYGATRLLARQLFARLGLPPQAVVNRADRSPIWPSGYLGTITHTQAWCGVALAKETCVAGVGIDAESDVPLETGVARRVLSAREWEAMVASGHEPEKIAALWFSAKESVYKCVHPQVQRFIGFSEVELCVDWQRNEFVVTEVSAELDSHRALLTALRGRFSNVAGLWVTAATVPSAL